MNFPVPEHSRRQVNKAGVFFITEGTEKDMDRLVETWRVINNWRSSHGYPINTFRATLTSRLKRIDKNAIIAQRLKRVQSIFQKLIREKNMRLARMQDIGGLRAVVEDLTKLQLLRDNYVDCKNVNFKHKLVTERDYIACPKTSGYRGIHLVYRYLNTLNPAYDGLLVELQIRTRLQHIWATAVETMGTFLNHGLKASEGPQDWLKFFSLSGAAFAHLEKSPIVPGYENLTAKETYVKLTKQATALEVATKLHGYSVATQAVSNYGTGFYHLVILDPVERTVSIESFSKDKLAEANDRYVDIEQKILNGSGLQVVLVSAGRVDQLRNAYPNYFLDTREFVKKIEQISQKV